MLYIWKYSIIECENIEKTNFSFNSSSIYPLSIFNKKIASFGWEKRIKRISTKIRCIFRFGKMIKRRARTTQIGNPWMNPDTNLKNIDNRQRDKLFLRSFLRSHEAARVVSGQAGGKSPFEAARSPLIAIWRFTFGPGYLAGSRRESTARENRKSPRGGWPRGRERGGGESLQWRGLERVVVCRVAISRGRLPSTGDVLHFLFTFLRSSLWRITCDGSHGRISCLTMVGVKYLASMYLSERENFLFFLENLEGRSFR